MAQNPDKNLPQHTEKPGEAVELRGLLDSRLDNVENISVANLMLDSKMSDAKAKWFPQNWYCTDVLFRCAEAGKKEMARSGRVSPSLEVTMSLLDRLDQGFDSLKKNCTNKKTGLALLEGVGISGREAERLLNHTESKRFLASVSETEGVQNWNVDGMAALSLYSFFQSETAITTAEQRTFDKLYLKKAQPASLVQILESISPSRA